MKARLLLLLAPAIVTLTVPRAVMAFNTNTGIVTDCNGNPLPGVLIYIAAELITDNCSNWPVHRVACRTTDANGRYTQLWSPDINAIHWCVVVIPDGVGDGYGGCVGTRIQCCNSNEPDVTIGSFNSAAGVDNQTFIKDIQVNYSPPCVTGVGDQAERLSLGACSPNPFGTSTTTELHLSRPGLVKLTVFDAQGRRVRRLLDSYQMTQRLWVTWDGRDGGGGRLSPGIYSLKMDAEGRVLRRTIALVR